MRFIAIVFVILAVIGAGGFFYLVNQADASVPAPHEAEVEVEVDLPSI
ncbi:MAG: hypothetical protein PVI23_03745 [Maricaulaceae bacterium]|jgi:hypothetical protein